VLAVCEVPFGGHPSKHPQQGLDHFEGYGEDYEFIIAAKKAAKTEATLQAWIDHWVLGCHDHEEYLRRVGWNRLLLLKGKIQEGSWEVEFRDLRERLSESEAYTPSEMAIIVAARLIMEKAKKANYRNILCGAGMANLAGWIAYYQLREQGCDMDIMAEAGMFGYSPRPGDPTTFNTRNFPTCKMLTDVHHVMGILMGGGRNRCIGSLGAGQIDRYGNINSTADPKAGLYMVGSGGANDIASSAMEIVVTAVQTRDTFIEEVPYITSPGRRVRTLVSTMGVFHKTDPNGEEFILKGLFPSPSLGGMDRVIEHVKSQCGWELTVAENPEWVDPPSLDELRLLRIFDPDRNFLGKL
jgi:acyl CoA:acetate/3-ketoacid CoA transferase beta subunit